MSRNVFVLYLKLFVVTLEIFPGLEFPATFVLSVLKKKQRLLYLSLNSFPVTSIPGWFPYLKINFITEEFF